MEFKIIEAIHLDRIKDIESYSVQYTYAETKELHEIMDLRYSSILCQVIYAYITEGTDISYAME